MQKGGDDEEEDDSQDRLQDIGVSTSFHARDGDVPVKKVSAVLSRHIGMNSSQQACLLTKSGSDS